MNWSKLPLSEKEARDMVCAAKKAGLIVDPRKYFIRCVICRSARATVCDHRDYNKPLEVDHLCQSCNILRGPGKPINRALNKRLNALALKRRHALGISRQRVRQIVQAVE